MLCDVRMVSSVYRHHHHHRHHHPHHRHRFALRLALKIPILIFHMYIAQYMLLRAGRTFHVQCVFGDVGDPDGMLLCEMGAV